MSTPESKKYTEWTIEYASKNGTPKKRIDWMTDHMESIVEQLRFQDSLDNLLDFDYAKWREGQRGYK